MLQESLNSITALLAEQLERTLDEPFKRTLAVRVDYWRSTLLQRSLEKHPEQRKQFWQTLWVPLKSAAPVSGVAIQLHSVGQSVKQIPLSLRGSTRYDYVGGIDGRSPFREASVGTIDYLKSGKYSGGSIYYELVNYKLNILSKSTIPMVRVDSVFDKPSSVIEFNCTAGFCSGWDDPYPVTGDILQMIIQYILQIDYNKADKPVPQINVEQPNANS